MSNENNIHSINFGKKERVLNYACQTYQLSRPNKVGAVMALIRECQPDNLKEWEEWYFANAFADNKDKTKITNETLKELGVRLYEKITETVIPEWTQAFKSITEQDCIDYIYNLTINRTYDGYLREKSVIYDGLAKIFPNILFEESNPELDHAGDIDYIAKIGKYAIGFQIKPISAKANFGSYSLSERMKSSFNDFTEQFGGKVFIIFSINKEVANTEIIEEIRNEINRLQSIQ
ncbi:MAG: MjaI family restriction endonuclease [Neisseriaceae bacterium]|nr:MjaI family restriction endonuclease [Neisseriaceae bacterium]